MPEVPDGERRSLVSHANPVTQAGYTQIPNVVLLRADISLGAKVVYGYLTHLSWKNGAAGVDPPQELIARDLKLSERAVRTYITELREAPALEGDEETDGVKLIETERRGLGMPNAYVINDPVAEKRQSRAADFAGLELSVPAAPRARAPMDVTSKAKAKSKAKQPEATPPLYPEPEHVEDAWHANAPPLIAHRASYFQETASRKAIAKAQDRYGTEDVVAAIHSYALVLSSSEHFFNYRWTLVDFLKRGLDRFVPEALPLENFRSEKNGGREPGVSVAEIMRQAVEEHEQEVRGDDWTSESVGGAARLGLPEADPDAGER